MSTRVPPPPPRGRPKNEKEERFYVPRALSEKLDAIAVVRNMSKSEYVRQIVERQVKLDLADAQHGAAPPVVRPEDPVAQWGADVHRKVDELLEAIRQPPRGR